MSALGRILRPIPTPHLTQVSRGLGVSRPIPEAVLALAKCKIGTTVQRRERETGVKIVDAKIFPSDSKHPNGWGTLLLCGMNMGGKDIDVADVGTFKSSFAALDITNPRDPVLLWEKSYDNLGLTINTPGVIKVHEQWFGTIGSGPTDYDGTSTHKGRVFIINLLTGELLKYFEGNENSAFMNSPVAVDKSLNYNADAIYVGESYLSGGQWRAKAYKIAIPIINLPYTEGMDAV